MSIWGPRSSRSGGLRPAGPSSGDWGDSSMTRGQVRRRAGHVSQFVYSGATDRVKHNPRSPFSCGSLKMNTFLFAIVLVCLCFPQAGTTSTDALEQLVLDAQEQLNGLSFGYEGRSYLPEAGREPNLESPFAIYTGIMSIRSDKRALAVEMFHFYSDAKSSKNNFHKVIATLDGKVESLAEVPDGRKGGTIDPISVHAFQVTGSFERIMPINTLRCYFNNKDYYVLYDGNEVVDGRQCCKISAHLRDDLASRFKAHNTLMASFWIDLERDAQVIKREDYLNRTAMLSRVGQVMLKRFQIGKMRLWIPVDAIYERFDENNILQAREYYHVNQDSLKIDELNDSHFRPKFKAGVIIDDRLRAARYEFGQDLRPPPPSRREAEERLREQLGKADSQVDQLDASRVANEEHDWLNYFAVSAVLASALIGSAILWRRRWHVRAL